MLNNISCDEKGTIRLNEINKPVLRIGDYEVNSIQFQKKLSGLSNLGIDSSSAHIILFDNFIRAGLLIEQARLLGYENTPEYTNKIEIIKNKIQAKYLVEESAHKYLLSNEKIELLLEQYPDQLYVDYSWIPDGYGDISDKIFELFEKKVDIDVLTRNPEALSWKEIGVRFYKSKPVQVGTLPHKLFKKVYNLQNGDLLFKKTQSGYHIIRLIHRLKNDKKISQTRIEQSKIDLAIAEAKEKGVLLADLDGLKNEAWIDSKSLSLIDFDLNPVDNNIFNAENNSSDSIAATFHNRRISEKDLIRGIDDCSTVIKGFFNNRSTRKQTTSAFILKSMGYEPYETNAKRKLEEYISKTISTHPNELLTRSDSVNFFIDWFDGLLKKFPNESLVDILYKQSNLYCNRFNDHTMVNPFEDQVLSPQKQSLTINHWKLEAMKTFQDSSINQHVLANGSSWSLSVEDFKKQLRLLTPKTRIKLSQKDNITELVKYLAEGSVSYPHTVKIDNDLLQNIDLIEYSIDSLKPFVSEFQVIGKLKNVEITVGELRSYVSKLRNKEAFIKQVSRDEAFMEYIVQQYIIQNSTVNNEGEKIVDERLRKYKYQVLSESLYNHNVSLGHINTFNIHTNRVTRIALKKMEKKRLDKLLYQSAKEISIEVNFDRAESMGIDTDKSRFSDLIKGFNSGKEKYD